MSDEKVPEDVVQRVSAALTAAGMVLTPHTVATTLRTLGWPVGDEAVLSIFETLRVRAGEDPEVIEARSFLNDHAMYERWKADVAANRTLGGFFEWREQQS